MGNVAGVLVSIDFTIFDLRQAALSLHGVTNITFRLVADYLIDDYLKEDCQFFALVLLLFELVEKAS
jgi:hypothetical protein